MVRPETIAIIRFVQLQDLENEIEFLEDCASTRNERKVVEKLRFVRLRYQGYSVSQASDMMGINHQTGYNWQAQWNEGGYGSVIPKKSPGRPGKLTEEQTYEFVHIVERNSLTTAEASLLLKSKFGISFTNKHVGEILHNHGLVCVKICGTCGSGCDDKGGNHYPYRWVRYIQGMECRLDGDMGD